MKKSRRLSFFRAQTIGEYALMVGLVISAVIAMQVYVQRTLQSRYRAGSRYLISQMRNVTGNANLPSQYEPYYTISNFTVDRQSNSQEDLFGKLDVDRYSSEKTERLGNQVILPGSEAD